MSDPPPAKWIQHLPPPRPGPAPMWSLVDQPPAGASLVEIAKRCGTAPHSLSRCSQPRPAQPRQVAPTTLHLNAVTGSQDHNYRGTRREFRPSTGNRLKTGQCQRYWRWTVLTVDSVQGELGSALAETLTPKTRQELQLFVHHALFVIVWTLEKQLRAGRPYL